MKILMLGWEFPPVSHGGLGRACHGLVTSLVKEGTEITFVVPVFPEGQKDEKMLKIISAAGAEKIKIRKVISALVPYSTTSYQGATENEKLRYKNTNTKSLYGRNLFEEVNKFTDKVGLIAQEEEFDIIHAHDWMTFIAGVNAKNLTGKPLVVHVHSTEFDRTGGNSVNQYVYDIEKHGMHMADRVITVSNMEKKKIMKHYGVSAEKIHVVHNAINAFEYNNANTIINMNKHHKIILFLGRVTLQKGPDYFLRAAKKVAEKDRDVVFVVAGSGDMTTRMIEEAAWLGISDRIFFTGYISDKEIEKLMKSASVLVMPSVSEPFGIVALEAMINKVPLIVSKQSGVIETVNHCMKVDFWDVDEMANKMLALLEYEPLSSIISENGYMDVQDMSWDKPAKLCMGIYQSMVGSV
ncbi:MAG: glycosyltransferase family 4 protein [Candidatus Aenigmarchaeota archaeon]|nr:glycosyltransferase family 4 protein [Candidatus Aenigmarchaeota archaeon]